MNNETANKVAEAIENSKNATVYSVAKQTGIPRTSLNRKLVGGTDFTVYEIARIAMALGVDPNDLLPSEFKSKQVAKMSKIAYSLEEATEQVGYSVRTIRYAIKNGDLIAGYANSKPVLSHKALEEWIENLPSESPNS